MRLPSVRTLNFVEHLDLHTSPSSEMKLKSIINKILIKLFSLIEELNLRFFFPLICEMLNC